MYMYMTGFDDEESQKYGIVVIGYYLGGFYSKFKHTTAGMSMRPYFVSFPFHVSSIHLCTDDPMKRALIASMMMILNREGRVKRKVHCGKFFSPSPCSAPLQLEL